MKEIQADVKEILEIFRASKGFFKVMGWAGKFALFSSAVTVAVTAIWHYMKG